MARRRSRSRSMGRRARGRRLLSALSSRSLRIASRAGPACRPGVTGLKTRMTAARPHRALRGAAASDRARRRGRDRRHRAQRGRAARRLPRLARRRVGRVVYVDSGSTDGSVAAAARARAPTWSSSISRSPSPPRARATPGSRALAAPAPPPLRAVRRRRLRAARRLDRRRPRLPRGAPARRRRLRPPARAPPRGLGLQPALRPGVGHAGRAAPSACGGDALMRTRGARGGRRLPRRA